MGKGTTIINLGGISNLTWWDQQHGLIAFDAGPANAPIDDWVRREGYGLFDSGGDLGMVGCVDESRLLSVMQHAYFTDPFPKSLDRQDFENAIRLATKGLHSNWFSVEAGGIIEP